MNVAIIDATAEVGNEHDEARHRRYTTPLANLPLIVHVVTELRNSGITRAVIVATNEIRHELGRILGSGHLWGLDVSYVAADEREGRQTVLSETSRVLAAEPVLLHPGDGLFGSQTNAMHARFCVGDVDAVLPEQASVSALRRLSQPRVSQTMIALGPGARAVVAELQSPQSEGDELVAALLASDCRLAVCEESETWSYSDSTEGLLAGNRMLLDRLAGQVVSDAIHQRNDVQGRVWIDASAYLADCVVAGPVAIAEQAVLESTFVGPYTAIGAGAVLRGAEIDNSMVLTRAEIHHPGVRLESSIIGERARVSRSFQLPRGVHLRLGPGAQLDFS